MRKLFDGLKAVIFDMDGVIVNTMPFHAAAWQATFKKIGVHITKKEIYLREGEKWDTTFFEVLKKNKIKVTKALRQEVYRHREDAFKNVMNMPLFRYAPGLIRNLKKRGLKLGLVTGTPHKEVKKILPGEIYDVFDVIVSSDRVKRGKPHPEPYLKALKALKIKAKEAIVIENAPKGITSAKKAKMKVIAVETSLPRRYLKEADFILGSLKEIPV